MATLRGIRLVWVLALAGPGILFAETRPAPSPAVLVEKENLVEAQKHKAAWKPAEVGFQFGLMDKLRTGEYSRAAVRWSDLSLTTIDELTTIEISPATAANPRVLKMKRGGLYHIERDRPLELRIRTASANGALKGTEFVLRVDDDDTTTLAMFEGEVELSNAQGRVLVRSGEIGEVELGRAPRATTMIDAVNIIQWRLYYPGVLDPAELGAGRLGGRAFDEYRAGDLPRALAAHPMKSAAGTTSERLFRAALILSSGQVDKARATLASVRAQEPGRQALERMIAAVQGREWKGGPPRTASEWVAESYYKQSRGELVAALHAARTALELSPNFAFAWVRAAEMEFSFGRTVKAMKLVERGLELAPRNAQAHALQGFLLAAVNRSGAARRSFDEAIALDNALGNAWLGRGLTAIRAGRDEEGRRDLQIAAILEPRRALLRSYLGKAYSQVGRNDKANIELGRALNLDPKDPTAWLYSAIQRKQENRYNEAIADLEKSSELNKNRGVFRSEFLLDQDRAIRGTNLASIYQNNGLTEQSVREAVRAIGANYASAPAHLFLANSYDALRDRTGVLTRYEAATFNELLLSQLLSPVGGGPLSQFVSQQEYSKLFEKDGLGFTTDSTYFSTGQFRQTASQFGTYGNISYALDAYYLYDDGYRLNNRLSTDGAFATFKLQLSPSDTLFLQTQFGRTDTGDLAQRFNQSTVNNNPAAQSRDFQERQDPGLLLAGLHHEWNPENHTLLLFGRLANRQVFTEQGSGQDFFRKDISQLLPAATLNRLVSLPRDSELFRQVAPLAGRGTLTTVEGSALDLDYRASFATYSAELEHIARLGPVTLIMGGRFQSGEFDTRVRLTNVPDDSPVAVLNFDNPPADQNTTVDFERLNVHVYNVWRFAPWLSLTAGLAYDQIRYPDNFRSPPINDRETSLERLSPKAGLVLEPWRGATIRGAYVESVSGASFDESIRLEPAQIAGFVQTYRSLASESLLGALAGSRFRIGSVSIEQKLPTRTYLGIELSTLAQDNDVTRGNFEILQSGSRSLAAVPSSYAEKDQYREESLTTTINQLIGECWSLGAQYRYVRSELRQHFEEVEDAFSRGGFRTRFINLERFADQRSVARLTTLNLVALYNHPSGFFTRVDANYYRQDRDSYVRNAIFTEGVPGLNFGTATLSTRKQSLPSDEFWQFNILAGWRFYRNQCEVSVGLLNITGQDYQLDPLNPYEELPRERTIVARCKLSF